MPRNIDSSRKVEARIASLIREQQFSLSKIDKRQSQLRNPPELAAGKRAKITKKVEIMRTRCSDLEREIIEARRHLEYVKRHEDKIAEAKKAKNRKDPNNSGGNDEPGKFVMAALFRKK